MITEIKWNVLEKSTVPLPKKKEEMEHGLRYSRLLDLPYFDFPLQTVHYKGWSSKGRHSVFQLWSGSSKTIWSRSYHPKYAHARTSSRLRIRLWPSSGVLVLLNDLTVLYPRSLQSIEFQLMRTIISWASLNTEDDVDLYTCITPTKVAPNFHHQTISLILSFEGSISYNTNPKFVNNQILWKTNEIRTHWRWK